MFARFIQLRGIITISSRSLNKLWLWHCRPILLIQRYFFRVTTVIGSPKLREKEMRLDHGKYTLPPEYNFVKDITKLMQVRVAMVITAEQFWQPRVRNGNVTAITRVHVRATTSQVDVNWKSSMLTELVLHKNLLFWKKILFWTSRDPPHFILPLTMTISR